MTSTATIKFLEKPLEASLMSGGDVDRFQPVIGADVPKWFWPLVNEGRIKIIHEHEPRPNDWGIVGFEIGTDAGPVAISVKSVICWDGKSLTVEGVQ